MECVGSNPTCRAIIKTINKMKQQQTAKTISLIVNGIRDSINDFTLEELTALLKQNQCPYWNRVTTALKAHNLIIKGEKNTYNFCKLSPIYYIIFENSLKKLAKRQAHYVKKWKTKMNCQEIVVIDPFEGLDKYSIKTLSEYLNKRIQEMYIID